MESYQMGRSCGRPYNHTCGMTKPQPVNREMQGRGCGCAMPENRGRDCSHTMPEGQKKSCGCAMPENDNRNCDCMMPGSKSKNAEMYGPLTIDSADLTDCDRWKWMEQPFPWEKEGACR